ncbi:hypothetical protein Dvar_38340 [Desulfosarcina variabilis str. Montpellier]|uniref:hypothetical protein n=1 Tax=Desulfosarcina variabilis TaxID=2300 RepID=UPI003AFB1828
MQTHGTPFYFDTLIALFTRPSRFYATRFKAVTPFKALIILTASSIFFAVTGALLRPDSTLLATAIILFINAMGMVVMGSTACYLALATTARRHYAFKQLFSIFSLSSGAVLLIAWVPAAFFITEPWKWWLIGTGMVNGLGMSKSRATLTVLFTFSVLVILIWALLPMAALGSLHSA